MVFILTSVVLLTLYPQAGFGAVLAWVILLICSYLEWVKHAGCSAVKLKMLPIKSSYVHRYYYWVKFVDNRQLIVFKSSKFDSLLYLLVLGID